MTGIPIYPKDAQDFSTNGICLLLPVECYIEEEAAGMYELTVVHPIDYTLRWAQIQPGRIIKAPAPVRESPVYEGEIYDDTTVTREIYSARPRSRLRVRTKPSFSANIIAHLKRGEEMIKIADVDDTWCEVIICNGGANGYTERSLMVYERTEDDRLNGVYPITQNALKLEPARDQLFRIYSVETDTDAGVVTAKAMHIFYDLRGNLIAGDYTPGKMLVATVVADINERLLEPSPIAIHPVRQGDARIGGDFGFKTPVEAYLDPEEGIIKQAGALLIRDNFEAWLLPDEVRDRGVTVRRGKNLAGVVVSLDEGDVITRVIPAGKDDKGEPLYLDAETYGKKYIERSDAQPDFIPNYTMNTVKRIDYDVSVGRPTDENKDKVFKTKAEARAELARLAKLEFTENDIDAPVYGMDVDMVLLGNTAEYADYSHLQTVHLYDTVTVIDSVIGVNAKVRVIGYKWDVLAGQYEALTLGDLDATYNSIYRDNPRIVAANTASSVARVDIEYYLSESKEELIGGEWSSIAPEADPDKFMWTRTKTTLKDGTVRYSTPTCIAGMQGAEGIGIESITNYYLATALSEGVTVETEGWTAEVQTIDKDKPYLWNYEVVFKTDGTEDPTEPVIIGTFGESGRGIKSIAEKYAINNSAAVAPTSWKDSPPEVTAENRYLWNYEIVTYSDNTTEETKKRIIGVYGEDGVSVASVYEQYYLSTSKTEQTGGSWVNTPPEWVAGKYLWIRTVITYSDGRTETTEPIVDTTWELADEALKDAQDAAQNANDAKDKADAAYNAYQDAVTRPEFERVIRVDEGGLHVGDNLSGCEVLIDSGAVHIVVGGQIYTSYGGGYLQLGDDIRIRRPKTGGVAFCPIKE